MNDILKQRLVGVLILVALGVVFWPIIFVEPDAPIARENLQIPERPVIDDRPIATPALADLRPSPPLTSIETVQDTPEEAADLVVETTASSKEPADHNIEAAVPTRTEAPETPALDADGVPLAWILRVASVSSADKAENLRQRLLSLNKKAYVQRVKREDGDLFRVYIGPKFEKAKLIAMQSQINAEFGVESMITRYLP